MQARAIPRLALTALCLLSLVSTVDDRDRTKRSRSRRAAAKQKSRTAEDGPNKDGTVTYRGKRMPVEKFLRAARRVTSERLESSRRPLTGSAVLLEGQLVEVIGGEDEEDPGDDKWVILSKQGKNGWEGSVTITLAQAAQIPDPRPGLIFQIAGIADEGAIVRAWLMDLAPPGIRWDAKLRPPGAVLGGSEQTFFVDGYLTNTGRQPIKRIRLGVRLYQVQSPNDWIEQYTIEDLAPGKTHRFSVRFDLINFLYIGKTSVPLVESRVIDYEL